VLQQSERQDNSFGFVAMNAAQKQNVGTLWCNGLGFPLITQNRQFFGGVGKNESLQDLTFRGGSSIDNQVSQGKQSFQKQWSFSPQGHLLFFGFDLAKLKLERPTYAYHQGHLRERVRNYRKEIAALSRLPVLVHYACKANSQSEILKTLQEEGLGADVVSGGELRKALQAGFSPQSIVFSGVGKTTEELNLAIRKQILQINIESLPELERLGRLAREARKKVGVALRLNPAVNPKTHPYIATGFRENKFGLEMRQLREACRSIRANPFLHFRGLSLHIGSQLFDFTALSEAIELVLQETATLQRHDLSLLSLDVGGGVGINYEKSAEQTDAKVLRSFLKAAKGALRGFDGVVSVEPGRYLVARAGALMMQVQYLKTTSHKRFVITNSGMNHLLRPALYQARHRILPVQNRPGRAQVWDVVGPVCESADVLASGVRLPPVKEGDWLAVSDVGAYGYTMASSYNSFALPDQILIKD